MKLEVEDDLFRVSIQWKIEEPGGAAGQEPVQKENVRVSGAAKAEGESVEIAGETSGVTYGRESETDNDTHISADTFDIEGVVWGAKEAEEGKEGSKEDSKKDREE